MSVRLVSPPLASDLNLTSCPLYRLIFECRMSSLLTLVAIKEKTVTSLFKKITLKKHISKTAICCCKKIFAWMAPARFCIASSNGNTFTLYHKVRIRNWCSRSGLQMMLHISHFRTYPRLFHIYHISRWLKRLIAPMLPSPKRHCLCFSYNLEMRVYGSPRVYLRNGRYHFWQSSHVNLKAVLHIHQEWLCVDLRLLILCWFMPSRQACKPNTAAN